MRSLLFLSLRKVRDLRWKLAWGGLLASAFWNPVSFHLSQLSFCLVCCKRPEDGKTADIVNSFCLKWIHNSGKQADEHAGIGSGTWDEWIPPSGASGNSSGDGERVKGCLLGLHLQGNSCFEGTQGLGSLSICLLWCWNRCGGSEDC